MVDRGLRLLSLDGGGVHGLSSLLILQRLMMEAAEDHNKPPKPCDYFDMIGGTSTGGLIAIMLGRLRMTIEDCISAYCMLADKVFEKKSHRVTLNGKVQGRFSAAQLEKVVKKVIVEQNLNQDELFKDPADSCKVFVCATSKDVHQSIVCFTTYPSRRLVPHLYNSTTIWQACRATSAATSFFDPIAIGPIGKEFVDGALGLNNPVSMLWTQAQDLWGDQLEKRLACLVSIGTGVPPLTPVGNDSVGIYRTLKAIATETGQTANDFQNNHRTLDTEGHYYRFNAHGMESIRLEESRKKKEVSAVTNHYLSSPETLERLQNCAKNLSR
ncbi:phospholipase, patatin family protein, partial [Neurospora tetraspora]